MNNKLKEVRKSKGLSIRKLSDLVKMSHTQIAYIESGKSHFSGESLEKIAKALGVKPIDLISEDSAIPYKRRADILDYTTPPVENKETPATNNQLNNTLTCDENSGKITRNNNFLMKTLNVSLQEFVNATFVVANTTESNLRIKKNDVLVCKEPTLDIGGNFLIDIDGLLIATELYRQHNNSILVKNSTMNKVVKEEELFIVYEIICIVHGCY